MIPSLPTRELLQVQAEWLSEARARMLRLAEIARRKRVLDLGAGYGWITGELRRRTSGTVIALDQSMDAIRSCSPAVCADARQLPFPERTFDLIFSQNVLMWIQDPSVAIGEIGRVLMQEGVSVLMEPDYAGMMEYPNELRTSHLWAAALERAGADPAIGRKLPLLLQRAGFRVKTELLPRLVTPAPERFEFLSELQLTPDERRSLQEVQRVSSLLPLENQVSHLPYFLIIAVRS